MNFRLFATTPDGTEYDLADYDQNAAHLSGTDNGIISSITKKKDQYIENQHAICRSGQEYSIHDSERIADQEMYECKRKMKAERT